MPAQASDPGARAAGPPEVTIEQTADEAVLDQKTANEETQRILAEVARTRNLDVTGPVKVDVLSRAGIRRFAKKHMYEEMTPQRMLLLGRIESSLGVIPVGADPETVILDLLEDGVLGLYDPKEKILLIGDFLPKMMLSMVVGHEIAHGLQDMHFDLEKLQEPMWHRADEESARKFLIEGDAQASYLAWQTGDRGLEAIDDAVLDAMGNQNLDLAGDVSDYPILARSLQMPYADGAATVIRLVRRKGWEAVDALYADLPETTEQMLHLDKLLAREPARTVKIDPEPLADVLGLEVVWHDTLGEASLLSMIAQIEGSIVARRSTDGWGGDAYVAFDATTKSRPAPAVVGMVAWDSETDAEQFEASLAKYLRPPRADNHPGIEGSFVRRKGDKVLFGTQVPGSVDIDTLATAAWEATEVGAKARKKGAKR